MTAVVVVDVDVAIDVIISKVHTDIADFGPPRCRRHRHRHSAAVVLERGPEQTSDADVVVCGGVAAASPRRWMSYMVDGGEDDG